MQQLFHHHHHRHRHHHHHNLFAIRSMVNKALVISSMAGQQGIQMHQQLPAKSTYKIKIASICTIT